MADARTWRVVRSWRLTRFLTWAVAASIVSVAPVSAQQTEADTNAITPAMVDLGRAVFHGKGMCFACHGQSLEGTQVAPTLKPHAWRDAKNGDYSAMMDVITKGVASTAMVASPGGVSRAEAASVAAYIWSVNNRKAKP